MPELPEVETIVRGMAPALCGRVITEIYAGTKGLRSPFPPRLKQRLSGRRVLSCRRRAKYILIKLDDGAVLALHLGMSGRIFMIPPGSFYSRQKHDHLVLQLDNGGILALNDARRFGIVLLAPEAELMAHQAFRDLGREPLEKGFDGRFLAKALEGRTTTIKAALLDQRIIAGVGNIYASEALFYAGIDPARAAGSLAGPEMTALAVAIRKVLQAALAAGGSTLKDYRHADGELGYFQHQFAVYDRAGMACQGCSCDISRTGGVQKITQAGRSTFYCPRRQV